MRYVPLSGTRMIILIQSPGLPVVLQPTDLKDALTVACIPALFPPNFQGSLSSQKSGGVVFVISPLTSIPKSVKYSGAYAEEDHGP